jgi:NAD(P)-dependent dehydrogenase (short-subunit alcohol dehydrogenase family)
MNDAQRPVALVTGSAAGFGLLSAVALADHGFHVVASMRDLQRRATLDAAAAAANVTLDVLELDVTRPESLRTAMEELRRRRLTVEVLVNNAGFGLGGFFEDVTDRELRDQFETNFFGLAAVTRAVLPGMRELRRGRVINISSVNGRFAVPGLSAYSSSKFAVEGLSESLRYELLPFGIYVVLVEPGTFKTDIFGRNRRVAAAAHDPASPYAGVFAALETFVDQEVARSTADPMDVARAIVRAATAPKPTLRTIVGNDARAIVALRAFLPARLFEAAVLRSLPRQARPASR